MLIHLFYHMELNDNHRGHNLHARARACVCVCVCVLTHYYKIESRHLNFLILQIWRVNLFVSSAFLRQDFRNTSFQNTYNVIYAALWQLKWNQIYIVIHRQICFVLSELISVARQYLSVAGIETRLTQTSNQSF